MIEGGCATYGKVVHCKFGGVPDELRQRELRRRSAWSVGGNRIALTMNKEARGKARPNGAIGGAWPHGEHRIRRLAGSNKHEGEPLQKMSAGRFRRLIPGVLVLILGAILFGVARLPAASAADRTRLASAYRFTELPIALPPGLPQKT